MDLLFPPKCPYCQGLLEGSYVPACTRCQPVLPWLVGTQGERKVDFTAGCLSPLAYRGKVVDSVCPGPLGQADGRGHLDAAEPPAPAGTRL